MTNTFKQVNRIRTFLFSLGALLSVFNLISLNGYSSASDFETMEGFPNDVTLTSKEAISKLNSLDIENEGFLLEANQIISSSISQYWLGDIYSISDSIKMMKNNLWITPTNNYIIWTASFLYPKFRKFQLFNYKSIISRGIGSCSQQALALQDFLTESGVKAYIFGLDGHVVVYVNDSRWGELVLDPYYGGAYLPYTKDKIQSNPLLIESYYRDKGVDENEIKFLSGLYERSNEDFEWQYSRLSESVYKYKPKQFLFWKISEILKWIIPVFLIFPLIYNRFLKRD